MLRKNLFLMLITLSLLLPGLLSCSSSSDGNTSPVADAGPDQSLTTHLLVTLDGSASTDTDGDRLTYHWSFSQKPVGSTATLTNHTTSHPAFTTTIKGSYVIRLVVNDGTLDSNADTVTITIVTGDVISPLAPANVQATVISSTQIDLAWDAPNTDLGITGYNIYRNGFLLSSTTSTTYSDTALNPEMTYIYTVTAYDAAGNESPPSAQVSAITRVLYVATNGNNSTGDGSATRPWATITHALDNVPDGSTILVKPGTYYGRVRLRGTFSTGVTVRAETPYSARLRSNTTVITARTHPNGCSGITIEGFDIAHTGSGANPLVVHIDGGGTAAVNNITMKNNVLHNSYNNDILKINNTAHNILITGNMFYNQAGSDEHIDINSAKHVVVQDNIFFNDFAGSGRVNNNNTSSYIVIKDSNGSSDNLTGSREITVRRNVFLNWQGSIGANFILLGEDGSPFHEAVDVLVENNLLLGNAENIIRAPFGVKGGKNIMFRHNSIIGDLPANAYAMRINTEGSNPANENIQFYNNVWSDPTGTMHDFSDSPTGETVSFVLHNNLYWNGAAPIPQNSADLINSADDTNAVMLDPLFGRQSGIILPRWNPNTANFADGSATISEAFRNLVERYGKPGEHSPVIDAADPNFTTVEDILGRPRPASSMADIGAYELFSP